MRTNDPASSPRGWLAEPHPRLATAVAWALAAFAAATAGLAADHRTVKSGVFLLIGVTLATRSVAWLRLAVRAIRVRRSLRAVKDATGIRMHSASIYYAVAVALYGVAAGVLVAACGFAMWWLWQRPIPVRGLATVAAGTATMAVVGLVFDALAPSMDFTVGAAVAVAAVSFVFEAGDYLLLSGIARLYLGHSAVDGSRPPDLLTSFLWNPVGATALTMVYATGSGMYTPLLFVVGLAFDYFLALVRDTQDKAARMEDLARQALAAEERERSALAVGLHDEAIPNLLVARQELELARASRDEAIDRADVAIARTVDHLRDTIQDLHPAVLRHAGLTTALRELALHHAERAGLTVDLHTTDDVPDTADARLIYSIARELLTNVTKHADATTLTLALATNHDTVDLVVQDDGHGFDPDLAATDAPATGHIGLHTVRERTQAHGGTIQIDSSPGHGTTIAVRLPIAKTDALRE